MKDLLEFLSDDDAFQEWAKNEEGCEYVAKHVEKAALFAMETELSEAQKRYITHYVIEGKTIREIAHIYGMSNLTVSKLILAGRTKLMKALRYTAPWLLSAEIEERNKKHCK